MYVHCHHTKPWQPIPRVCVLYAHVLGDCLPCKLVQECEVVYSTSVQHLENKVRTELNPSVNMTIFWCKTFEIWPNLSLYLTSNICCEDVTKINAVRTGTMCTGTNETFIPMRQHSAFHLRNFTFFETSRVEDICETVTLWRVGK